MEEKTRKGYGRRRLLKISLGDAGDTGHAMHAGKAGNAGSVAHKGKPETAEQFQAVLPGITQPGTPSPGTKQSLTARPIAEPPSGDLSTLPYEIVEGWALPCST